MNKRSSSLRRKSGENIISADSLYRLYQVGLCCLFLLLVSSCKDQAIGPDTAPITAQVNIDIKELIPDLGWCSTGKISRSVLTADSITIEEVTLLNRGRSVADPKYLFGQYEYEVVFKNDTYELWIYAYTNEQNADFLDVRTGRITLLRQTLDDRILKNLEFTKSIILGQTKIENSKDLPGLGIPADSGRNSDGTAAIWKYYTIDRFHMLKLQFDESGVLSKVVWVNV
jgi:hypothetical protein